MPDTNVAQANARERLCGPASFRVGGVPVSAVDLAGAHDHLFALVNSGRGGYVTVTSAHGVVEAQRNRQLFNIFEGAALSLPDGSPLFWAGRVIHRQTVSRVPGEEFFSAALADPRARRFRHYFYGGQEPTVAALVQRATASIGAAAIAGWHCPDMQPAGTIESAEIIERIRQSGPGIVWVGLSTPKQEHWMANHAPMLPGVVCVGVGAAFDFYAGVKDRGPKLMRSFGFEWLYRMTQEPRRLWPRYRVVVPRMLAILARDAAEAYAAARHDRR